MRCNNCGAEITPNMASCPVCGMQVQANLNKNANPQGQPFVQGQPQSFEQQGQGTFGQPNYTGNAQFNQPQNNGYYNQGYGAPNGPVIGSAPEYTLYLIIGILYTICCCNILIGIPGIIFTCLMNSAFKMGNAQEYAQNKKIAKVIYIVGIILWIVSIIFGFLSGILEAILESI